MIYLINEIIQDITDSSVKFGDTLLKVQVLAFKLKNDKLKTWVNNELNGFRNAKSLPLYRTIKTPVIGNIEQDRGFGLLIRSNVPLGTSGVLEKYKIDLLETKLTESFSTYEHMFTKEGEYAIDISSSFYSELSKFFGNDWMVSSAWKVLSLHTIRGVLDSIKSSLLQFLLEIAEEIGESDNIDIIKKKNIIDNLFEKNLGSGGNTINIISGSNNIQAITSGDDNKTNITQGDDVSQSISDNDVELLKEFIYNLKDEIKDKAINKDDLDD